MTIKLTFSGIYGALLLALAVFAAVAAPLRAGEDDKAILHVYTWDSYFDEDVVAAFEDRYNCDVSYDYFNSNEEMFAEILAGRLDFDIATPSAYIISQMTEHLLLERLDLRLIPNAGNIDPEFFNLTHDKEMRHSVPYTRTITGVGYNRELMPEFAPTWGIFSDPRLRNRLTLLSDMRETIGAALKYLGHSLNTVDPGQLAAAEALLRDWKQNIARFEVDESNLGLGSNELAATHAYNGDIAMLMGINPDIGFFVPREGAAVNCDSMVVLATSSNKELAHAFINHLLDVDNAAANMESIRYYMPIPAALAKLPAEVATNPTFTASEETLSRCEAIMDLGAATELYEKIWEDVVGSE